MIYRALWPMEWHRWLLALTFAAPAMLVLGAAALSAGHLKVGLVLLGLVVVAGLRLKDFRFYWTWRIEVTDEYVRDSGGFRFPGGAIQVRLKEISRWRKTPLRGRGNFRFDLYCEDKAIIWWQSNYFPQGTALEADLAKRLGAPERPAGDHRSGTRDSP